MSLPVFDQIWFGSLAGEIVQRLTLGLSLKKSQYYTVLTKKTIGKLAQNWTTPFSALLFPQWCAFDAYTLAAPMTEHF